MLRRKLVLLIIVFSFVGMNMENVTGATTAGWGDIVNLEYALYLDAAHTEPPEDSGPINYVYLGSSVPQDLAEKYQQASAEYLEKFKEGVVGATLNQEKSFVVDGADGYPEGHPSGLGGKDLYFVVTVLEIVYDASAQTTTTTTTTTTQGSSSNLLQDFGPLIAIGGGLIVAGGIYTLWSYRSSQRMKSVSEKRLNSTVREQMIKKEKSQLKELRELTESFSGSEDTSQKSEVKFRRRR